METDLLKRCEAISEEQRALFAYYFVVIMIFRRYKICEYERNIEYQPRTFARTLTFVRSNQILILNIRTRKTTKIFDKFANKICEYEQPANAMILVCAKSIESPS